MCTAVVDNLVFLLLYRMTANILESQAIGRVAAVAFNYSMARSAVFHAHRRHLETLPRYLLLVLASGAVSYALLNFFHATFGMPVIGAKLLAEGILFTANFAVQRDFVFPKRTTEPEK
jgi:putative flippase GtrA